MRYPKGLVRRADEILAARRQTAQERHRRMMAALDEQHPEIRAVGRELALLYAQRARLQLDPVQDTGEVEAAIHEAQARRAAAIAAAGLTEADLEPAYTCPLCGDRGVKEGGQMCECRQVILNQLVYEQLCDVSPARGMQLCELRAALLRRAGSGGHGEGAGEQPAVCPGVWRPEPEPAVHRRAGPGKDPPLPGHRRRGGQGGAHWSCMCPLRT